MSDIINIDELRSRINDARNKTVDNIRSHPKIFGVSVTILATVAIVVILALFIAMLVYKNKANSSPATSA